MNASNLELAGVYAITPCGRLAFENIVERTEQLLSAGLRTLQYRDKAAAGPVQMGRARQLADLCHAHGALFIVNDSPQVAAECGADGLHLGADDPDLNEARAVLGHEAIIGVSCYDDISLATRMRGEGADYVAFGAFFPTTTKSTRTRANPDLLARARQEITGPIVAIGGITPDNSAPLLEAGADALAIISSIYLAENPVLQLQRFQQLFLAREGVTGP